MSQFRVEKRRVEAELTFSSGATLRGAFFLAASTPTQIGPERVADLLNAEPGFFPFDPSGPPGTSTVVVNRAHVVAVKLLERSRDAQLVPGYDVAAERRVVVLLSNGERLGGSVRVYCPQGRDRMSDWARSPQMFRYLEGDDATFIVNAAHVIEVRETRDGEALA